MVLRRSRARRGALQAVYQWQMSGGSGAEIRTQFREREGMDKVDWGYFDALVQAVIDDHENLDALLIPHLDRPLEQVDPVELAIMRLATLELRDHLDVPYRVAINEAIELARRFGADGSHRYVNGVLDVLARQIREAEVRPA
jgi:N utilization substance protein B